MADMVKSRTIEDFEFANGKKHPKLKFKHAGIWHTISFSMSPRGGTNAVFVERDVRRIIRGKTLVQ